MLSNATLAISIENAGGFVDLSGLSKTPVPDSVKTNIGNSLEAQQANLRTKQAFYFSVILWSTFGLSFARFLGVCLQSFCSETYANYVNSVSTTSSDAISSDGAAATNNGNRQFRRKASPSRPDLDYRIAFGWLATLRTTYLALRITYPLHYDITTQEHRLHTYCCFNLVPQNTIITYIRLHWLLTEST